MSILLDLIKKSPKTRVLILTGAGAMLGYFGNYAFTEIEALGRQTAAMAARVERLENDDAKWGTLAEQKKQLVDLAIEVEVLKRTWFRRALNPRTQPTNEDELMEPPAMAPPPFIKSPEEFRQEQNAKYPSKK